MIYNFYDFDDTIAVQDYAYFFATLSMEKSLENSEPLPCFEQMISQHKKGEKVFVLTARGYSKSGERGIQMFLRKWGVNIPKSHIFMVGISGKPKADVIERFLQNASKIRFYDDLPENINAVREMAIKKGYPNLETHLV